MIVPMELLFTEAHKAGIITPLSNTLDQGRCKATEEQFRQLEEHVWGHARVVYTHKSTTHTNSRNDVTNFK